MERKVVFSKEEEQRAKEEGAKRFFHNRAKGNKHIDAYASIRGGMTALQADQLGVVAEMVVVKFLMLPLWDLRYWSYFVTDNSYNVPEVMGVAEVRRVNEPGTRLAIRTKDVEENAINVKVFVPYTSRDGRVTGIENYGLVQGWEYATKEVYEAATPTKWPGYKRVATDLRDPDTLLLAFEQRVSEAGGWAA